MPGGVPIVGPGLPCPHHGYSGMPKDKQPNAAHDDIGIKTSPIQVHDSVHPSPDAVGHIVRAYSSGSKRISINEAPEEFDDDDDDSDEFPIGTKMDTPNVVRGKINRFVESGEMTITAFCNKLGVSQNSYRRFLSQNGRHGEESDTYVSAWKFFERRKRAGVKMPAKKQKTTDAKDDKGSKDKASADLSDVHLNGEDEDSVLIYDTCAGIRRKISAHLRKPGATQVQLCRDLHAQYHTSKKPSAIPSSQLARFRGQKEVDGGNTSSVYYAAYVYVEKMRLKEKKPKSKHRQEMEGIWPNGFDTEQTHTHFWLHSSETASKDKYGQLQIHQR